MKGRVRESKSSRVGFTLIEVVLAVAVLAIGILAALGMQTAATTTTTRMSVIQSLRDIAMAELDFQRSVFVAGTSPVSEGCEDRRSSTQVSADFDCEVVVLDCTVTADAANCAGSGGAGNAFLVHVTASRGADSITLSRVLGERAFVEVE